MPLHTDVLPRIQRQLFERLARQPWLQPFYLAGGTALALHIGHRRSIDFDFFSPREFSARSIREQLAALGSYELFTEERHTMHGALNGVKVSFFAYPYPLLHVCSVHHVLSIASLRDIALMKLSAISGRGSRKDFVDLAFLLDHFTLRNLLRSYPRKFGKAVANPYHLLKSLVYFADAEQEPMPCMIQPLAWSAVKSRIMNAVRDTRL